MRRLFFIMLGWLCLSGSSYGLADEDSTVLPDYVLNIGDVISIDVFNEKNLSIPEARMTSTGMLAYPFLGNIKLQGKTLLQVQSYITQQLKGRLPD